MALASSTVAAETPARLKNKYRAVAQTFVTKIALVFWRIGNAIKVFIFIIIITIYQKTCVRAITPSTTNW